MTEQQMAEHIARLETSMRELQAKQPSAEDLAYLQNMRIQSERMAWAKGVFKAYSPWAFTVASVLGTAFWGAAKGVMWVYENVSIKK